MQIGAGSAGFDEALIDRVREVPGVYRATRSCSRSPRSAIPGARRAAAHPRRRPARQGDQYFRSYGSNELEEIRRDPLAFLNSETNLILSRRIAQKHGYKLRDTIALSTGTGVQRFTIWGFIDDEGVGRAFGGAVAVMYYPAMQVAFARGRNLDRIDVATEKGVDYDEVTRRLQAALGPAIAIESASLRGGRVEKMLQAVGVSLNMSSLIALSAALFLIYNTMAISVVQRKRELGILRALGTTRREMLALIMLEGGLLGTVASAVGMVFALLLSRLTLSYSGGALAEVYLQETITAVELDPA